MDINFLGDSHWKNRIVIGGLVEEWGGEYKICGLKYDCSRKYRRWKGLQLRAEVD